MRKQNIALFSSGNAFESNFTDEVRRILEKDYNCICHAWHDEDFFTSNDPNEKALLPYLLKIIPTYDFIVLIADKCDLAIIQRGKPEFEYITRDNVIIELGFSIMAIGTQKTLLLRQDNVRLPEDLVGVGKENGIFVSVFKNKSDLAEAVKKLGEEIKKKQGDIFPIVIGAAGATAESYFTNFVNRFFTSLPTEMIYKDSKVKLTAENTGMNIILPPEITNKTHQTIEEYYEKEAVVSAKIQPRNSREISFKVKEVNGKYIVIDMPTTISASFETVQKILSIEANDRFNDNAKERFLRKEIELFKFSLNKLMESYDVNIKYNNIRIIDLDDESQDE